MEWVEEEPINPAECQGSCVGKSCGSDGCGASCGICDTGESCSPSGQCKGPGAGNPFGGVCEPTDSCNGSSPGWPECLNSQCASEQCLFPVCTQSCGFLLDVENNATGEPGPDGVEDPGFESCSGASEGPFGDQFRCVDVSPIPGVFEGMCIPGTTFLVCDSSGDCPEGERCALMQVGGVPQLRCVGGSRGPRYRLPVAVKTVLQTVCVRSLKPAAWMGVQHRVSQMRIAFPRMSAARRVCVRMTRHKPVRMLWTVECGGVERWMCRSAMTRDWKGCVNLVPASGRVIVWERMQSANCGLRLRSWVQSSGDTFVWSKKQGICWRSETTV